METYQRQCEWSEGWDAAQAHYEQRLGKMVEEYETLLKDAIDSANRAASTIERLEARAGMYERTIEEIKELIG